MAAFHCSWSVVSIFQTPVLPAKQMPTLAASLSLFSLLPTVFRPLSVTQALPPTFPLFSVCFIKHNNVSKQSFPNTGQNRGIT